MPCLFQLDFIDSDVLNDESEKQAAPTCATNPPPRFELNETNNSTTIYQPGVNPYLQHAVCYFKITNAFHFLLQNSDNIMFLTNILSL